MLPATPTSRPRSQEAQRTLRDELHVLRRRKWIILAFIVLVPLIAFGLSLRQAQRYRATSKVLLTRQNLPPSLTGNQAAPDAQLASRNVDTNVQLAQVQPLASNVIHALSLKDLTARQLQANLTVSSGADTDLLIFSVTDRSRARAIRLANEYARQFVLYRGQLDTAALRTALAEVQQQLHALSPHAKGVSSLRPSLRAKAQQLKTYEALQTSSATVVQNTTEATQVRSPPVRNTVIGLALGVALGVIAAFVAEALDTRVRSEEEISQRLGVPLLGRIPEPTRGRRRGGKLVMLEEPHALEAEAFRVLRTNVYFALLGAKVNTIMLTSASQGVGKSTTVANLAVALARDGVSVTLVDLDLRVPGVHRIFGLSQAPGVTDLALRRIDLDSGLNRIDIGRGVTLGESASGMAAPDDGFRDGELKVVAAGTTPPDPGDFIGTSALTEVLDSVVSKSDLVLIDAPPVIGVGDAIRLTANVDAVIGVVNVKSLRREVLNELRRVFDHSPARILGFVATGTSALQGYG